MSGTLHRERFAAVCELLTSPVAGERDAAAVAANRMLKAAGTKWTEVIASPPATRPQPHYEQDRGWSCPDWRIRAADCLGHRHCDLLLNAWERNFLSQLERYRHHPSDRQMSILADIERKLSL